MQQKHKIVVVRKSLRGLQNGRREEEARNKQACLYHHRWPLIVIIVRAFRNGIVEFVFAVDGVGSSRRSIGSSWAQRLVGANDELAQEFVAKTVKIVAVEGGIAAILEICFCYDESVDDSTERRRTKTHRICSHAL